MLMKTIRLLNFLFITFLINPSVIFCQSDSTTKTIRFHDTNTYIDIQFPQNVKPIITAQFWTYFNKTYWELRYNYEDRKTGSILLGRAIDLEQENLLQLIPTIGITFGNRLGISPGLTTVLESKQVRAFSQNQYFIGRKKYESFFLSWSAVLFRMKGALFLGISEQVLSSNGYPLQVLSTPVVSFKKLPWYIDFYYYNFWNNDKMIAIGIQNIL